MQTGRFQMVASHSTKQMKFTQIYATNFYIKDSKNVYEK